MLVKGSTKTIGAYSSDMVKILVSYIVKVLICSIVIDVKI
jgi:hypothetical protein